MVKRKKIPISTKDLVIDFGFGSEIYFIEYVVNGIVGRTVVCPNASDMAIEHIKTKHGIKRIDTFEYSIIKQIGESLAY